jgi:hypothetical protein
MHKTFLLSAIIAIFLLGAGTNTFGGVEPSPWKPIGHDLQMLRQEIAAAQAKLAGAEPGANLMELALTNSHENLLNLLHSLQAKVKGLQGTKGQKKRIMTICNNMKPKLAGLDVSHKNFSAAIKRNDGAAAQELLDEMEETVKALENLIAK